MTLAAAVLLVGINVFAFCRLGWDKICAHNGRRRAPESELLCVALFGGAAVAAQQIFPHKTRKQPFRTLLWGAAAMNVPAALAILPSPAMRDALGF